MASAIRQKDIDKYSKAGTFTEDQRSKGQTSDTVRSLRANQVFCV
jgi:hypothetical protein